MCVIAIGISCSLVCCIKNARKVPVNYILLFIFTCCWTYMVASFTQWFEGPDVMIAATLTTAMVIGLTLFACCCKMKLTWLWAIMGAMSMMVFPLLIFSWMYQDKLTGTFFSAFMVVLTSIYIVYDTRMILKKLSLDDYIIGALMLYTDIL